ncbi:MAG: hypothetical protein HUU37_07615, partial [Bdellovibrionales bacterium]|nr:hypothetical protein [Bdellovibrionales bacterium]
METKPLKTGLSLIVFGILIQVSLWRPHLGLMDDANYFYNILPAFLDAPWKTMEQYGLSDIEWGMWRPLLPAMAFLVYWPGLVLGGASIYFWNAVLVIALAWFHAGVSEKVFSVDRWKTLTVLAGFFYFHDLFQHPSLQEKMILFFGAILLHFSVRPRSAWFWCGVPLFSVFGMSSKASFSIYLAVSGWIIFCDAWNERGWRAWARVAVVALWYGALVLILAKIARGGTYTSALYSLDKIVTNL